MSTKGLTPGAVILVTGASGAIGFEVAAQAAEAGAVVIAHGSSPASAQAAAERVRARVPQANVVPTSADFREAGSIATMVSRIRESQGRLDGLVHCAITAPARISGAFADTDPDHYGELAQRVIGSLQLLCYAAMPLLARQGGTIVAFAADSGSSAAPRQSLLAGVYGGIMSFVRSLALEVARDGVRVHCLSPSFVENTPIFERHMTGDRAASARRRAGLGLPGPVDIAPMVLFLCGRGASKITGQIISINGGINA